MAEWGVDACYSCTQKCIGAPSGLAPVAFAPAALERRVPCRSFYFDLGLLEAYWRDRKYHHTISASLVYALHEALTAGGTMPAVLNAANEAAVQAFLDEKIGFMDIPRVIKGTMEAHKPAAPKSVDDVMQADRWARSRAAKLIKANPTFFSGEKKVAKKSQL